MNGSRHTQKACRIEAPPPRRDRDFQELPSAANAPVFDLSAAQFSLSPITVASMKSSVPV